MAGMTPFLILMAVAFGLTAIGVASLTKRGADAYRSRFQASVGKGLSEAFLFSDVLSLLKIHVALVIVLVLVAYWLTGTVLIPLVMAIGAGALPRLLLALLKQRRIEKFRQQTPDALSLLAGGLKAGSSLPQMVALAAQRLPAPAGQEFELMVRQQKMGSGLDQCLRELDRRIRTEETKLLVAALQIGSLTGGNTAEALESLASATRRKLDLEGKIMALTAQGRLQAWVMAALPFLLALALYFIDPASMEKLFSSAIGWTVIIVVVLMQSMGAWMIRKIVSIEI